MIRERCCRELLVGAAWRGVGYSIRGRLGMQAKAWTVGAIRHKRQAGWPGQAIQCVLIAGRSDRRHRGLSTRRKVKVLDPLWMTGRTEILARFRGCVVTHSAPRGSAIR